MRSFQWAQLSLALLVFTLASFLIGCQGIQPAPPAGGGTGGSTPAPTASLTANPTTVNAGQSTTLTWQTTNATTITIDGGVGTVAASGTMQVTPTDTTTYHLTATGTGGSQDAAAAVTVNKGGANITPIHQSHYFHAAGEPIARQLPGTVARYWQTQGIQNPPQFDGLPLEYVESEF